MRIIIESEGHEPRPLVYQSGIPAANAAPGESDPHALDGGAAPELDGFAVPQAPSEGTEIETAGGGLGGDIEAVDAGPAPEHFIGEATEEPMDEVVALTGLGPTEHVEA